MKKNPSKELIALYLLAEKLVIMENKGYQDDHILNTLLQIANAYLDFSQDTDVIGIELASYFPIKTNPDLDDNDINVAFVERPKGKVLN